MITPKIILTCSISFLLIFACSIFCSPLEIIFSIGEAAVMESESYKLQFDSVNIGGERQTSESYIMEDTIGEIGTGEMESANYYLKAGYQQMNETYLSLSDAANVTMSGITRTNATSTGGTTWSVITDNPAGYKLEVAASATSSTPCDYYLCDMEAGNSFTDYFEASGTTPEVWNTSGSRYEFGLSAYGDDVSDSVWGSGDNCGSGTDLPQDLYYRGFNDVSDSGPDNVQIATRSSRTETAGVVTNFCLGAVQTGGAYAPTGTYTATTTATLTAL